MKVLLLEDDIALSDILSDFLEQKGHDVTICSEGEVALESLVEGSFDFAILDINTPTMSGIDVLRQVREDFKSQTPIIVMTAYQDTKHLKTAFELGSDDYIRKPFDLEELDQRINRLCRYFSIERNDEIKISDDINFNPLECMVTINGTKIHIAQKERYLKIFCKS